MKTFDRSSYVKERRTRLKQRGICVDCETDPVAPGLNRFREPHVCCAYCLEQRRDRERARSMPLGLNECA